MFPNEIQWFSQLPLHSVRKWNVDSWWPGRTQHYTQTKSRVDITPVRAISAYGSPFMRIVLHWSHWLHPWPMHWWFHYPARQHTKNKALSRVSLDILKLLYFWCYIYSTFNVCVLGSIANHLDEVLKKLLEISHANNMTVHYTDLCSKYIALLLNTRVPNPYWSKILKRVKYGAVRLILPPSHLPWHPSHLHQASLIVTMAPGIPHTLPASHTPSQHACT